MHLLGLADPHIQAVLDLDSVFHHGTDGVHSQLINHVEHGTDGVPSQPMILVDADVLNSEPGTNDVPSQLIQASDQTMLDPSARPFVASSRILDRNIPQEVDLD